MPPASSPTLPLRAPSVVPVKLEAAPPPTPAHAQPPPAPAPAPAPAPSPTSSGAASRAKAAGRAPKRRAESLSDEEARHMAKAVALSLQEGRPKLAASPTPPSSAPLAAATAAVPPILSEVQEFALLGQYVSSPFAARVRLSKRLPTGRAPPHRCGRAVVTVVRSCGRDGHAVVAVMGRLETHRGTLPPAAARLRRRLMLRRVRRP